jgi:V/A-type H+-transporting ATPase subunit F
MYKIGVIGDRETVLGFSALGLDIFPVTSADEAARILHSQKALEYAVLYITESWPKAAPRPLSWYRTCRTPAVILIPSKDGAWGCACECRQASGAGGRLQHLRQ